MWRAGGGKGDLADKIYYLLSTHNFKKLCAKSIAYQHTPCYITIKSITFNFG